MVFLQKSLYQKNGLRIDTEYNLDAMQWLHNQTLFCNIFPKKPKELQNLPRKPIY